MAKKKKDADFKKIKLKVGRKLERGLNDTKTDFKTKKLILKEAKSLGKDPVRSLLSCSNSGTQLKLICLSKVSEGCLIVNVKLITGELVSTLSRHLLDNDSRVRTEARKCIRQCVSSLETAKLDMEPMFSVVINFLKCGITHIDSNIRTESRNLMQLVIDKSPKSLHSRIMAVVLSRFTSGHRPDTADFELCANLLERIKAVVRNAAIYVTPVHKWSKDNAHVDINEFSFKPSLKFDISFQSSPYESNADEHLETLSRIVAKELHQLSNWRRGTWTLTSADARTFVAVVRMATLFEFPKLTPQGGVPEITLVTDSSLNASKVSSGTLLEQVKKSLSSLIQSEPENSAQTVNI